MPDRPSEELSRFVNRLADSDAGQRAIDMARSRPPVSGEPRTGYEPRVWYSPEEASAYRDGYDDAMEHAEARRGHVHHWGTDGQCMQPGCAYVYAEARSGEPSTEAGRELWNDLIKEHCGWQDFRDAILAIEAEARATPPSLPSVDELAQIIRQEDGNHSLGAGALAEAILARLSVTSKEERP